MDNERFEPVVGSTPPVAHPVVQDPTQLHIVEATPPPSFTEVPVAPFIDDVSSDPTIVVPVQAVPIQAVQAAAFAPVAPTYEERFIQDERRPAWPYIAAVVALLLGGLAGYLIGSSVTDDAKPAEVAGDTASGDVASTFDMLLVRTRADGEYTSPSEYPQLDEITAIDNGAATESLQTQVEMLTIAQDEAQGLTDQVAMLESAVADLTAERDALAAQAAGNGGANSDMQAELDDANAQIETLTADLATARSDLDAANASLKTAQSDLAAANAAYDALVVTPAPDYVRADIARVRTEADANGWTLIEQPTNSTTFAAGTVLEPSPAAGTN
ncbi:MAG: hypothetical protein Q8M22_07665, partial [Actinomycetota bacterium]|nr:hypothetical protein [Actinomycetota bacterium]